MCNQTCFETYIYINCLKFVYKHVWLINIYIYIYVYVRKQKNINMFEEIYVCRYINIYICFKNVLLENKYVYLYLTRTMWRLNGATPCNFVTIITICTDFHESFGKAKPVKHHDTRTIKTTRAEMATKIIYLRVYICCINIKMYRYKYIYIYTSHPDST